MLSRKTIIGKLLLFFIISNYVVMQNNAMMDDVMREYENRDVVMNSKIGHTRYSGTSKKVMYDQESGQGFAVFLANKKEPDPLTNAQGLNAANGAIAQNIHLPVNINQNGDILWTRVIKTYRQDMNFKEILTRLLTSCKEGVLDCSQGTIGGNEIEGNFNLPEIRDQILNFDNQNGDNAFTSGYQNNYVRGLFSSFGNQQGLLENGLTDAKKGQIAGRRGIINCSDQYNNNGQIRPQFEIDLGLFLADRERETKPETEICLPNFRSALWYRQGHLNENQNANAELIKGIFLDPMVSRSSNTMQNEGFKCYNENISYRICFNLTRDASRIQENELMMRIHLRSLTIVELIDPQGFIKEDTLYVKSNDMEKSTQDISLGQLFIMAMVMMILYVITSTRDVNLKIGMIIFFTVFSLAIVYCVIEPKVNISAHIVIINMLYGIAIMCYGTAKSKFFGIATAVSTIAVLCNAYTEIGIDVFTVCFLLQLIAAIVAEGRKLFSMLSLNLYTNIFIIVKIVVFICQRMENSETRNNIMQGLLILEGVMFPIDSNAEITYEYMQKRGRNFINIGREAKNSLRRFRASQLIVSRIMCFVLMMMLFTFELTRREERKSIINVIVSILTLALNFVIMLTGMRNSTAAYFMVIIQGFLLCMVIPNSIAESIEDNTEEELFGTESIERVGREMITEVKRIKDSIENKINNFKDQITRRKEEKPKDRLIQKDDRKVRRENYSESFDNEEVEMIAEKKDK